MAAKKKTPAKKSKPAPKKKSVAAKSAKKPAPSKKPAAKTAKKTTAKKLKRPVRTAKRPSPRRKVAPKKARVQKPVAPAAPEAFALARTIAQVAADKKATDILILDMRQKSSSVGYDYLVLATGESDRQLSAIQEGVDEVMKPQGKRPASVEASADWVCVTWDEGVVSHFFTADRRELMDLEGLWKDAARITP